MNGGINSRKHIITVMAILWVAMAFSSTLCAQGKLGISFEHYIGSRPLALDTAGYKNELGQSFNVTKLKYYIGHIRLKKADGRDYISRDYFLVNEEESETKNIVLPNIPAGAYSAIDFIIGVDSADNCSGAQSGALDPVNAMFWAWNTGYIFFKMEGTSPQSGSPGKIFEFHIGGYKAPANCIRHVSLTFKEPLVITAASSKTLRLKVDAAEVLKTPSVIDFVKLSSVTDFHNAAMIADNYQDMFSVAGIE